MTRLYSHTSRLLVLFYLVTASSASHCTVCQDGSYMSHPSALVAETGQTCGALAEEASYYTDPIACRYYHRYGNACGCQNVPPLESSCNLCQNDQDSIPDASLYLDGYEATCAVLQTDAQWNLFSTFSADQDDPVDIEQDNCNYYHHIGSLCGCQRNQPPDNGCTLCLDGSPPLLPDKTVTPNNAAEETCAAFGLFTQYQYKSDSTECQKLQSVVGSYCGCSTTPKSETCDFCPTGWVTREGWSPDVEFATDNKIFFFRDAACIKVAMLASTFEFPCGSAPRDFIEGCCEPALDGLEPEVFLQQPTDASHNSVPYTPRPPAEETAEPFQMNWDEFVFSAAGASTGGWWWLLWSGLWMIQMFC